MQNKPWLYYVFRLAKKLYWKYWIVVFTAIGAAIVAGGVAQQSTKILARQAFELKSAKIISQLQQRMQKYEDALWAGVAAIQLHQPEMDVNQWRQFHETLATEKKYPGVNGIGVIRYVPVAQRQAFLAQQRRFRPDFDIFAAPDEIEPASPATASQNAHWVVTYIEPEDKNARALGLDLSHESRRFQAAKRAQETGNIQMTAPVTLIQDSLQTPGFLLFLPFYRNHEFAGLVYAPFIIRKLITSTLGVENRDIAVRIYDGNTLLYDEFNPEFENYYAQPLFIESATTEFYGRQWHIEFHSLDNFSLDSPSWFAQFIVVCAVCVNLLLVYMLMRLKRAKRRFESAYSSLRDTHLSFINSSGDGYFDWMMQGDYEYMSPRFWQILGYEADEKPHLSIAWQELVYQEDLKVSLQNLDLHIKTKGGYAYEQELRFIHKNGKTVTALRRGKVIEWDGDKPVRMIGTLTDVTELKQQSGELEKTLAFQQMLLNVNTDVIFVKNERYEIVQANPAFMSLYPEDMQDKIIGYTTVEEFDHEQAQAFLTEDIKAFAEGLSEVIETIDCPDGITRSLFTKKIRFTDAQGQDFILCIARDISDMVRAEQELKEANKELEEFAYRTSHDLRSPLISSRKMLTTIQEELQQGKIDKAILYAGIVRDSMDTLHNRVSDILRLARFNYEQVEAAEIDFPSLFQDVVSTFQGLENFQRVVFEEHYQHQQQMRLPRVHVELILENLLSNAIKYQDTQQNTSFIKVTTTSDDKWFVFKIEDNGMGIPKPAQPKLFAMFKRFHPSVAFGSGVGLYMVKKAVMKLQGDIHFEDLPDGSCFVVRLPLSMVGE